MTEPRATTVALVKRLYHSVPLTIRYRYSFFSWQFHYQLKRFFYPLFPELVVLEGQEKNSGAPITMAYTGSRVQARECWAQQMFMPGVKRHFVGRHFFLNIPPYLRRHFPDCNLFLSEHNSITQSFSLKSGFAVPEWVDMELDISNPIERLLGNQREGIQRRIRKFGLSYEITRDPKYFDDFYYNMYVPYMRARHSEAVQLDTYSALHEVFSRGELILVKNENAILCAGLFEVQNQKVRCRKMGVRDGRWEYVREGVIGACYYFLITEMKKRCYKKMHLGGTRPFLSDGVTKFKISLKAELASSQHNSCLTVAFLKNSQGLQSFLTHNPFICFEKSEEAFRAVFFQSEDQDTEDFNTMIQANVCHGLADSHIFVFGDLNERSNYFFSVKPAWPLFDHSMPLMPSKPKVSWIKKILSRFSIAGG
jgi:hypothetical protein